MTRILRFALLFLVISLASSASAQAGKIVADSGFRPGVNGFSFDNYGDDNGYKNLDVVEMQKIFGRAACLAGKGSKCVLNPGVRSWMEQKNADAAGGHCYGFSSLAQLIYKKQLPRFGYGSINAFGGGPNAYDLSIKGNTRLQRSIARAFSYQFLPSVLEKTYWNTPNKILRHMIKSLKSGSKETWNLVIFQWGFESGHAITPYAVEKMPGGIYKVHVYDNNWQGDATRRMTFNTKKNTWRYYASTQPGIPQATYAGNAKSKTMFLKPDQPALGIQQCSVCAGRQGANSKYNQISLSYTASQHARLLITDPRGRQTGFRNGKLVNRIPGARILHQASSGIKFASDGSVETLADSPEPIYLIPKNLKVKIRIDGRKMKVRDQETLGVVGPTFDATIENLKMGPGKVAYATLSPKKQTLSMTGAKGVSSPRITFGAQGKKTAYRINAVPLGAPSRSTFYFAKKPRYQLLRIDRKQGGKQNWAVIIDKFDASGKETKFGRQYRLRGNQVAFLYYGPLASGKPAYVVIASANGKRVKMLKLKKIG